MNFIHIFHPGYHPKYRAYSKKLAKEQVCLYPWAFTINHYENEDENKKYHIDATWIDLGLDMDTSIVNIY